MPAAPVGDTRGLIVRKAIRIAGNQVCTGAGFTIRIAHCQIIITGGDRVVRYWDATLFALYQREKQ